MYTELFVEYYTVSFTRSVNVCWRSTEMTFILLVDLTLEWVRTKQNVHWSACSFFILTVNNESDGQTGFVLSILVIDRLGVVTASIGRHRGEDDQCVVQSDGTRQTHRWTYKHAPILIMMLLRTLSECPSLTLAHFSSVPQTGHKQPQVELDVVQLKLGAPRFTHD